MGLRPAKSHEKLSGRRLADEILWGRLVTCGRLAIGPCRLRSGPAAVTNRRAGCQAAPHWFFAPVLPQLVDDVGRVLELRRAGQGLLENHVGDAGGGVLGQVGGPEVAGLAPAEPPLLAQILEVVDLAAAFPIDVDGAQR